jgi:carbon monoxide dehydrogenase subunit G
MEMTGERRIAAPRLRVWEALNDPAVLQAAIPGCEGVERTGEDSFSAKVALKLGPMAARFGGKVQLSNINPPHSYTISGEGQGGAMGFAKGGADVSLEEEGPDATVLRYSVKAQVGGKMAQLGARLIDSTAKSMADQFFDRFAAQLAPPAPEAPPLATPAAAPEAPATAAVQAIAAAAPVPAPTSSPTGAGWKPGSVMDIVSTLLSIRIGGHSMAVPIGIFLMLWVLYLIFLSS